MDGWLVGWSFIGPVTCGLVFSAFFLSFESIQTRKAEQTVVGWMV
jgi:hypothetical protein